MLTTTTRIAALAAIAATGVAQYFVRVDPNDTTATACLLVAALAAALFLRRGSRVAAREPITPSGASWDAIALLSTGAGLLVVYAGNWILLASWKGAFFPGWGLFLLGTALMSAGLRRFDGPTASTWRWGEGLALAGIVAVAAALRFHSYGDFPGPFTTHAIEEQQTGLGGFRVLTRGERPWEFWLDYHITALALYFDPKPTFNTIRIPYTVLSTLTVVPVYFLLRQLMRTPAAMFGTLLYALSSWNLVYSRCAHPIFPTNLLVVAVLALLVHYGRTRRLAVLPWIGLLCGYTLYSYAGYRGTPLFAIVFLGGCVIADLWRGRAASTDNARLWRIRVARDVIALVILAVVTLAVAAPITRAVGPAGSGYYFEAAARSMANREYYTDDFDKLLDQRLRRMRDSARIFMHFGDGSHTFNVPTEPMLDPVTAVLFVVGLFIATLDPRRRYNGFLVFTFLTLMFVGTVFVQNLDVRRLQGITIFVVAFSAITFDRLWGPAGRRGRAVLGGLALVIAGCVGWWSYDLYFRRMAGDPAIRMAFHDQYTTLIHWGYTQPEKRPILLQSIVHRFFDRSYHYRYNYSWLIDEHLTGRDLGDATDLLNERTFGGNSPRTVVVQENFERHAVGRMLAAAYPGTTCSEMIEPYSARTALTVCTLPEPPGPPRVVPRLTARYAYDRTRDGNWFLHRDEPFLGFSTYPSACYVPRPGLLCRGEWEGTFTVPGGEYTVALVPNGRTQATATVDGKSVPLQGLRVSPGDHHVRVEATLPRDWEGGVRLVWRHDGIDEPIPFY